MIRCKFFDGKRFVVTSKNAIQNPGAIEDPDVHGVSLTETILDLSPSPVGNVLIGDEERLTVAPFRPSNFGDVGLYLRPPILLRTESEGPSLRSSFPPYPRIPNDRQIVSDRVRLRVYLAIATTGGTGLRKEIWTYLALRVLMRTAQNHSLGFGW